MSDSPAGEYLDLRIEPADLGIGVLIVEGTIDGADGPRLKERISDAVEAGRRLIAIDLTLCEFVDSMALAVLVGAWLRLRAGGRLVLVAGDRGAGATLRTAGIDRTIDVFAGPQDALAALRDGSGAPTAA